MARKRREMKFNIGWELEAIRGPREAIKNVERLTDGSVGGDSLEYRTSTHIVGNNLATMQALRTLSTDKWIKTDKSCGFHVHLSTERKTRMSQQWVGWMVTLGRMIEQRAFQAVPSSRGSNSFCRRWETDPMSVQSKRYNSSKYSNDERYKWVNVVEMYRRGGIKTVEIRLLGSTHRLSYLGAWIGFCYSMANEAWRLIDDPSGLLESVERLNRMLDDITLVIKPNGPNGLRLAQRLLRPFGLFPSTLNAKYNKFVQENRTPLMTIGEYKQSQKYKRRFNKIVGIVYKLMKDKRYTKLFAKDCKMYSSGYKGYIYEAKRKLHSLIVELKEVKKKKMIRKKLTKKDIEKIALKKLHSMNELFGVSAVEMWETSNPTPNGPPQPSRQPSNVRVRREGNQRRDDQVEGITRRNRDGSTVTFRRLANDPLDTPTRIEPIAPIDAPQIEPSESMPLSEETINEIFNDVIND